MFRVGLPAALVLAAIAPVFSAEPADTTKIDKVLEKLDQVLSKVGTVESRLSAIERSRADTARDIGELRLQMDLLQRELADLRSQMSGQRSTSAKFGPSAAMALATVRLFNDYPTMMSVTVNGVTHDLLPGETRNLSVTPGAFSLQVHGVHPLPVTRTVGEGKTYPLRIHLIGQ